MNKRLLNEVEKIVNASNFSRRDISIAMGITQSAVSNFFNKKLEQKTYSSVYRLYKTVVDMQDRQYNEITLLKNKREKTNSQEEKDVVDN